MNSNYSTKKLGEEIVDKSKNIRTIYSLLLGRTPHVLVIIVVGHLLVEYTLSRIILEKKLPKKPLNVTFIKKLEALYPTWLPLHIYENIKRLNKIRNNLVHNLGTGGYDPFIYDYKRRKTLVKTPKGKNKTKFYLRELIETILYDIINYSHDTLKISVYAKDDVVFRELFLKRIKNLHKV